MSEAREAWLGHYEREGIKPTVDVPNMSYAEFALERFETFGDYLAIKYSQGPITYSDTFNELGSNIEQTAKMLKMNGVEPKDKVMHMLPYIPEAYSAKDAIARVGGVIVPEHPRGYESLEIFIYKIKKSGVSTIICLDSAVSTINELIASDKEIAAQLKRVLYVSPVDAVKRAGLKGKLLSGIIDRKYAKSDAAPKSMDITTPIIGSYTEEMKRAKNFQGQYAAKVKGDDLASIVFTSGTSGRMPDGCFHTHNAFNAAAIASQQITFPQLGHKGIVVPGMFHCFGLNVGTHAALTAGIAQIAVPDPRDLEQLAKVFEKDKPEFFVTVPLHLSKIRISGYFDHLDLSHLELVSCGGARLGEGTLKWWNERGVQITEGYGASETMASTMVNLPSVKKPNSGGIPNPGYDVKLIDIETGKEITERYVPGEMHVSGPSLMTRTIREEKPASLYEDVDGIKWYKTGDLAHFDSEYFVKDIHRMNDVINMNNANLVNPIRISQVLENFGVEESLIFKVSDENDIDKLVVCIQHEAQDSQDLEIMRKAYQKAFETSSLRGYEIPSEIILARELPRTTNTKPIKSEAEKMYAAGKLTRSLKIRNGQNGKK